MGIGLATDELHGKARRPRADGLSDYNVFGIEQLLTSQFMRRQQPPASPERRLMLAVLEDAVMVIGKYRDTQHPQGQQLYREAMGWVASDEAVWPFSFVNICEALDFDVSAMRKALGEAPAYTKTLRDRGPVRGPTEARRQYPLGPRPRTLRAVV